MIDEDFDKSKWRIPPALPEAPPREPELCVLPFMGPLARSGSSGWVDVESHIKCSIVRLTVTPETEKHFWIQSIRVGRVELIANSQHLSTTLFSSQLCRCCAKEHVAHLTGNVWPVLEAHVALKILWQRFTSAGPEYAQFSGAFEIRHITKRQHIPAFNGDMRDAGSVNPATEGR